MTPDPVVVENYISSLERPRHELTPWETEFLESVTDQWTRNRTISQKQLEILERIYDERV